MRNKNHLIEVEGVLWGVLMGFQLWIEFSVCSSLFFLSNYDLIEGLVEGFQSN
jgi:hypothetical protein